MRHKRQTLQVIAIAVPPCSVAMRFLEAMFMHRSKSKMMLGQWDSRQYGGPDILVKWDSRQYGGPDILVKWDSRQYGGPDILVKWDSRQYGGPDRFCTAYQRRDLA